MINEKEYSGTMGRKETSNKHTSRHQISDKSRLICLLLHLFLGVLGAHRMYVGRWQSGVLQLLFGWLTLFIWNLVDLFMIIAGNFRDVDGKKVLRWEERLDTYD